MPRQIIDADILWRNVPLCQDGINNMVLRTPLTMGNILSHNLLLFLIVEQQAKCYTRGCEVGVYMFMLFKRSK